MGRNYAFSTNAQKEGDAISTGYEDPEEIDKERDKDGHDNGSHKDYYVN